MNITITLNTDSAAFTDSEYEVSELLINTARKIQIQILCGSVEITK